MKIRRDGRFAKECPWCDNDGGPCYPGEECECGDCEACAPGDGDE